jgi:hypothetical protein
MGLGRDRSLELTNLVDMRIIEKVWIIVFMALSYGNFKLWGIMIEVWVQVKSQRRLGLRSYLG